ncbi:TraR/DksA C4-type zinc finger protein [Geminicoccus flavidas]|uniref:hypothetical protein n=1 Tax=Geminicoccus flavidas TaxID=2506407 RepID=UPI0013584CCD|nr:hypothetical protein [Geminicoccus flavidas]
MSFEDRAQEHEVLEWELRNAARPAKRKFAPSEPEYGPAECDDCEAEMPEPRRAYGYHHCVHCAERREKRR